MRFDRARCVAGDRMRAMRSDFANSANRSARKSGGGRAGKSKRAQTPQRTLFHGPSFSGGVLLGGLLVLAGAYLPEWLPHLLPASNAPQSAESDAAPPSTPAVNFVFDELLRNNEVASDPTVYVDPGRAETPAEPMEYLLQAASFRSADEANALRARLLLLDLPAMTDSVALTNGRWYRVTVGPFDTKVAAQRAMTELRQRDISPMWIKRKAA